MNKLYIALLVVVVLGSGAYFYFGMQKSSVSSAETAMSEEKKESPAESMKENEGMKAPVATDGAKKNVATATKTFKVAAANFSYDVKEIKVKQGDTVKIVFTNGEGFHDWVIDEFNARTQRIGEGQTETIEFVANKKGTFEYYCSVGSHRAMGMKGNLIVE